MVNVRYGEVQDQQGDGDGEHPIAESQEALGAWPGFELCVALLTHG
jgi:hypothetical protein